MSARPGGWAPGIGWVARECDVERSEGARYRIYAEDMNDGSRPVIVTAWPDGTVPTPDADPVAVLAEATSDEWWDDDATEALLTDLNAVMHEHFGSDGSDDAQCDWVNDLANAVASMVAHHAVPVDHIRALLAGGVSDG